MKKKIVLNIVASILTLLILWTLFSMFALFRDMSGNARVINYAGIIRGATQRLVKLEISNKPNDELLQYLDQILYELQNSGNKYNLKKLEDKDFQKELNNLNQKWSELKQEIKLVRQYGAANTSILAVSEEHFKIANNAVHLAEDYGERLVQKFNKIENILLGITTLLALLLIGITSKFIILKRNAKKAEELANIDFATGLPNKNKCERLFIDYGVLDPQIQYGVIMFDLNNLKITNDTFGHKVGDSLISNFGSILKNNVSENSFVGRYGGDEFIAVFHHTSEEQIKSFINVIAKEAKKFNFTNQNSLYKIDFSVGYALSNNKEGVTLQVLFDRADENMYNAKRAYKGISDF